MNDIERDVSFLKDYVGIVQGIEMLEFYDSNFLSGDNASRCKAKIEHLNLALKKIDEISKLLEDKSIGIIEKDAEIKYLKCLLNDNNIDF